MKWPRSVCIHNIHRVPQRQFSVWRHAINPHCFPQMRYIVYLEATSFICIVMSFLADHMAGASSTYFFFLSRMWWNIHNIKFTAITIWSMQFSGIKSIHNIVQSWPLSISRTSLLSQTETLYSSNNSPVLPPLFPGNLNSTFCLHGTYSRYLI